MLRRCDFRMIWQEKTEKEKHVIQHLFYRKNIHKQRTNKAASQRERRQQQQHVFNDGVKTRFRIDRSSSRPKAILREPSAQGTRR